MAKLVSAVKQLPTWHLDPSSECESQRNTRHLPHPYRHKLSSLYVHIAFRKMKIILSHKSEKNCPTPRALDAGESARLTNIFLASSFFCSQTLSTPANQYPVKSTQGETQ